MAGPQVPPALPAPGPHLPLHTTPRAWTPPPPGPPRRNWFLVVVAVLLAIALSAGVAVAFGASISHRRLERSPERLADAIATQVSTVRRLEWLGRPPVRVVSREEMRALIAREFDRITDSAQLEMLAGAAELLEFLRVLPPDTDLLAENRRLLAEAVEGLYLPDEKSVVVVAEADVSDPTVKIALAHELTHALTDQHFDLAALEKRVEEAKDSERRAALEALIEGDAMFTAFEWARRHLGSRDIDRLLEKAVSEGSTALDESPRFLRESLQFPYEAGTKFVEHLYREQRWSLVDSAYSDPPRSTEEVLHPDRYLERLESAGERTDPSPPELAPDDRCRVVSRGVVGEFDTYLVLSEFLEIQRAKEAAEGWEADRYLFEHCGDKRVLRLAASLDSARDAEQFERAWADWIDRWDSEPGNYPQPGVPPGADLSGQVVRSGRAAVDIVLVERIDPRAGPRGDALRSLGLGRHARLHLAEGRQDVLDTVAEIRHDRGLVGRRIEEAGGCSTKLWATRA